MLHRIAGERLAPVLALVSVYLALQLVLRVVLQFAFGAAGGVSAGAFALILPGGLLNDAVQAVYLFAPLLLVAALLPERAWHSRAWRRVWLSASALVIASLLFLGVAEYFFFEEFDARFNIVAFDYLMYPTEVVGDIRSEYPLVPVLIGALVAGIAITWAGRRWIAPRSAPATAARPGASTLLPRLAVAGSWLLALIAVALFWPSDVLAHFDNRVARELIQNGHSTFFRAVSTSELDYHDYYRSAPREANLARLAAQLAPAGGRFVALEEGRMDRAFEADPHGLGKLNVVLIASESFGAEFSQLYGSQRNWTPNFDRHAREGMWFSNAYASGARTVRGLEALTCSLPPIPPVSILRRPGGAHVSNWGTVMRGLGYHTSFLYGGYGYFDNMNAFYESNGFEVIDRANIDKVRFANVWGVSDEDLFDRALQHFDELDAKHEPFFSIVMTTSNHKPFTFRPGLEALGIPPSGGGREAGVRYADHALGYLLDQARSHRWFDDTIFVVIADHGARVYGRQDIPLKTYEIPAMIWSPKHVAPQRVDTLFGQIDVAPTVLGLLGLPYVAPFFGVDVLKHPEAARVALFNHNHDVALMRNGELAVLGLNRSAEFQKYDRPRDAYVPMRRDADLEGLAIAYYQTAFELFRAGRY